MGKTYYIGAISAAADTVVVRFSYGAPIVINSTSSTVTVRWSYGAASTYHDET